MTAAAELSNAFVCAMGIGIVFFGLVCLVLICFIMGLICRAFQRKEKPQKEADTAIPNKQEMLAAVSCAIAEELGRDVSAIRIISFKKM